ncbi:MAG: radical SAM protein [Proteobacteria bacterium]|nr:radical SAM protein [Pseudomonadota bacterium]
MSQHSGAESFDSEIGAIRKQWTGRVSIALVYPNRYAVGMANLGFQSVYRLLNEYDGLVCERVFLPEPGKRGQADRTPRIQSVESGRPLKDFQVVAFSISFENDFAHVLSLIDHAGLPLRSNARGDSHPLMIAGGVACLLNPEPLAPIIDCFLIGEGEALFSAFAPLLCQNLDKKDLLPRLARDVPGAYVPSFYTAHYHPDGTMASFGPNRDNVPETIKRTYLPDLSETPSSTAIVSPASAFDASFLTEVSRGCAHGCRFCSAGYIYRPPRFRSPDCLKTEFDKGAALTDRIGLVGTAISDYKGIGKLCASPEYASIRFSYSSLRADAITADHLNVLTQSGTKTATIAPDGGSERLRRVINKGITEEHILSATRSLIKAGIPNIKAYFMIGLPGETPDDMDETIALCKKIKEVFLDASREKGRMGQITVGVSSFVPKAFTPFQWAAMDTVAMLKKKIQALKNGLNRIPNLTVNADSPRGAIIQALLSRGDRKVGELLLSVHQNQGNWVQSIKESALDPATYIHRERGKDELFPWDFIDHGISKSFLRKEYELALSAKTSPPCPMVNCNRCGVCTIQGK